jgi:hypothetical protein
MENNDRNKELPKRLHEIIRFDPLGIDETDIEKCADIDTLIYWKSEIERTIQSIKSRILSIKTIPKHHQTHETILDITKAEKYRKLIAILHQKMLARISHLKREMKNYKQEQALQEAKTIDYYFREVAKEVLTGRLYTEIIVEAKDRFSRQEITPD